MFISIKILNSVIFLLYIMWLYIFEIFLLCCEKKIYFIYYINFFENILLFFYKKISSLFKGGVMVWVFLEFSMNIYIGFCWKFICIYDWNIEYDSMYMEIVC